MLFAQLCNCNFGGNPLGRAEVQQIFVKKMTYASICHSFCYFSYFLPPAVVFMPVFLRRTAFLKPRITEFRISKLRPFAPRIGKPRISESIVFEANKLFSSALFTALETLFLPAFLAPCVTSPESFCACTAANHQCGKGKYP